MAQYKVPQDVEADDKLLGPFSFRQFVYLMVTAGFIAAAWALFQLFPLLVLIPLPIIIIFAVLALPLRKDQPMETYLAAIVSFFLKPKTRLWHPGQRESTVLITVPKIVEKQLKKTITEEEASRRLSFLAEVADSEGRSIKNPTTAVREEFIAEANAIDDMFTATATTAIVDTAITTETAERHAEAVDKMRAAIAEANTISTPSAAPAISHYTDPTPPPPRISPTTPAPVPQPAQRPAPAQTPAPAPIQTAPTPPTPTAPPPPPSEELKNLTTAPDLSISTIQKEANRITKERAEEVYISLH